MDLLGREAYETIARTMYEHTGVYLAESKAAMIRARLHKRLTTLGLSSFRDYCKRLDGTSDEVAELINALTTNKTDFFREPRHFEFLVQQALPEIVAERREVRRKLRVWSAACSSGEEAYTLGMVLHQFFSDPTLDSWDYKVLGTDIDSNVLRRAERGVYSSESLSTVPREFVARYFVASTVDEKARFGAGPVLRSITKFRRHNLMDSAERFRDVGFQIIFLRNALIYFSEESRRRVINNLLDVLVPGGFLIVGHSESLHLFSRELQLIRPSVYRFNG